MDKNYKGKESDYADYLMRRRYRWDEWGSPVGLGLAWTLLIVPLGIFLYLLHLAGII